ncbi:MAG TPA: GNAT family N-acetyltransferase [Gaiellaceae bacterium]|nr:GNAT family N-acetyltransferase [Gaiellaceae bacterium]
MIELRPMTPAFLEAVLGDRRDEAARLIDAELPDAFPTQGERRFLGLRLRQMEKDERFETWCPHAIVLDDAMIGHAGYHGPPGINSTQDPQAVEYGYTIFPAWRGHGYATEAAVMLMDMAEERAGIRRFVLSVSPENDPSLAIVRKLGFVKTGEQMDEEDGLEDVFELER